VRLSGVTDSFGQALSNTSASMRMLIGDSNGDGTVNSGDALQTRGRSGQPADAINLRSDFNIDGFVNSGDAVIVRAKSGNSVP